MSRYFAITNISCALMVITGVSVAQAQITEFTWNGSTGTQQWRTDGNWDMTGFPDEPDGLNKMGHTANLAVPLGSNLTLNIDADVTVAGLKFGGTTGAVTTNITSTGPALLRFLDDFKPNPDFDANDFVFGRDFLIWQRGFSLTGQTDNQNGDADLSGTVDGVDLAIWEDNYGRNSLNELANITGGQPFITTSSVAGSVNRITSGVRIVNENLVIRGDTDLVIDGALTFENGTPVAEAQDASISNISAGITTTINGNISLNNQIGGAGGVFGLNSSNQSQGNLIINGVISDGANTADLNIGINQSGARHPLNTIRLNAANTYNGSTRLGRSNIELAHDHSLGFDPTADDGNGGLGSWSQIRQAGPSGVYGYNLIPVGGDRTLGNEFVMAQFQTFKGSNSLTLSGHITQTNNRGFVNLLDSGETLTLTGRLDIWEDDEALKREFIFDGTGKTVINGDAEIRGDPTSSGADRRILKRGTGSLTIDVGAGDNNHSGDTTVLMGNFHYATNNSLNQGSGKIVSHGGAVGVDTGVASNSAFLGRIDSASTGGLMLAASDAAANLNFTSALSNAARMTVAAPETGLTYTGTITPANSKYGLGGGTGTLTLPNAQLTGSNSLEVRNGGTVELLGDNTYTGTTTIITKYSVSGQEQAAANSDGSLDPVSIFYDRLVAPTLVVDDLANGGSASSIGSAGAAASNLLIQGSTLKYVGTGDSTDRLFTIGTGGATIDSSGGGAIVFSNAGALGRDDAESRTGSLNGTDQPLGGVGPFPTGVYNLGDTSDIVVGMTVSDPNPGTVFFGDCGPNDDGSNCIPEGTVVTSVSETGFVVNIDDGFGALAKLNTQIVFGTVERALTLAGSNGDDNTLASIISDSPMGGVVAVDKVGTGKWILTGSNSYSGDTTVEAGTLSITNAFLNNASDVNLLTGGELNLDFSGQDTIANLFIDGVEQSNGLWGAVGNGAATFTSTLLTGSGLLNVGGVALSALASVPEPNTIALVAMACLGLAGSRRRAVRK